MLPLVAQSSAPAGVLPVVLFYAFAGLTVASAFMVAFAGPIFRSAWALLGAFIGVAGLLLLLHAQFLAAVHLMVDAGGMTVLLLFGLTLSRKRAHGERHIPRGEFIWASVIVVALVLPLLALLLGASWNAGLAPQSGPRVKDFGAALLDAHGYLVIFELFAVLLLAVLIGAAYFVKGPRPAQPVAGETPGAVRPPNAPSRPGVTP